MENTPQIKRKQFIFLILIKEFWFSEKKEENEF